MSRIADIQLLMESIGPASPAVSYVTQVSEDTWTVGLDEQSVVFLEFDAARDRLVLTSTLGRPREGDRERLYEALLGYNALWRETGGVQMALADGEAMQAYSMPAADLELDILQATIEDFAGKASIWRSLMRDGVTRNADSSSALAGMRV